MKRILNILVLVVLIVSLFSVTTFAASTGSTTVRTDYLKQVMLIPTAYEGSYNMFVYANVQIDSPYSKNGFQWVSIKQDLKVTPAIKTNDFTFDAAAIECLVNYFLDDYFFAFENLGMSEFQPYKLIEKDTNTVVANSAMNYIGDYQFPMSELTEGFGIELQDIGFDRNSHVIYFKLDKKFVYEEGEK